MLLVPKLLWPMPADIKTRSRAAVTRQACLLLQSRDWQALYEHTAALQQAPRSHLASDPSEAAQAAEMLRFAKRGQPMRAFHSIGSPGIMKPDEHTVNTLADLLGCKDLAHPQAWLNHLEDHSVPARLLPGLDKAVLRLKRGKSTDQHGWSAEAARI
eukprot:6454888-Amphidinium_carterae.1